MFEHYSHENYLEGVSVPHLSAYWKYRNSFMAKVKIRCLFWYDIETKLGFSGLQLLI